MNSMPLTIRRARPRRCWLHGWALALVASMALLPTFATAWSGDGHRIVAEIAARQINQTTRERIAGLLALTGDRDLASVASWADEVRGQPGYRHTAPWHYVNLPPGQCEYRAERDCPGGNCIVGALSREIAILADPTRPAAARAEALRFVVHFVGDLHQPLHVGRAADRGGNLHQVFYRDEGTNLHGIWDYWLVRNLDRHWQRAAKRLAKLPHGRDGLAAEAMSKAAILSWLDESCQIVNTGDFYPPTGLLAEQYLKKFEPVAEARLRLAGARLARLLDAALDIRQGPIAAPAAGSVHPRRP